MERKLSEMGEVGGILVSEQRKKRGPALAPLKQHVLQERSGELG